MGMMTMIGREIPKRRDAVARIWPSLVVGAVAAMVVSTGATGHAESVRITFDPSRISYGRILQIFFAVAHDPT